MPAFHALEDVGAIWGPAFVGTPNPCFFKSQLTLAGPSEYLDKNDGSKVHDVGYCGSPGTHIHTPLRSWDSERAAMRCGGCPALALERMDTSPQGCPQSAHGQSGTTIQMPNSTTPPRYKWFPTKSRIALSFPRYLWPGVAGTCGSMTLEPDSPSAEAWRPGLLLVSHRAASPHSCFSSEGPITVQVPICKTRYLPKTRSTLPQLRNPSDPVFGYLGHLGRCLTASLDLLTPLQIFYKPRNPQYRFEI